MQDKATNASVGRLLKDVCGLRSQNLARINDSNKLREFLAEILTVQTSLYNISKILEGSEHFLKSADPDLQKRYKPGRIN